MNKKANIRNSTAEFLIFTGQSGENRIEVQVAQESVWLTQKMMGVLFEVSVPTVNEHLHNLFNQNEISKSATIRNFRIVQKEGEREVARNIEFYNLEAIIAVGFRINSLHAIQFRQWITTQRLKFRKVFLQKCRTSFTLLFTATLLLS